MVAPSLDHKPDNILRGSCSKKMDLLTLPPQTTELSLYCADIDDDDLKRLQNLPLRHLSDLTNLHLLRASHNAKAGRDLPELGTLTKLEVLDLWLDAGVDDTAMQAVASMPNLRYLDLQATSVGDIGLMNLYCLNNLESVNLNSTKVTLRGQRELQEAKPKIQFGPAKTLKLPRVLLS